MFDDNSDVTVVITSCGRFDLLQKTLESFVKYNNYPIKKAIITEDSGLDEVHSAIPESMRKYCETIINRPKLGQIASIDLAYSKVDTPYIFHCEDDWEFYRPNFIEDSKLILEQRPDILQVWLRSYYHDIAIHSGYHYLGERELVEGIPCYHVLSTKEGWYGFSFNPGLKRLSDYKQIGQYGQFGGEKALSIEYHRTGMKVLTLENDAVAHIGFGSHIEDIREKEKKKRRKRKDKQLKAVLLVFGFIAGALIF